MEDKLYIGYDSGGKTDFACMTVMRGNEDNQTQMAIKTFYGKEAKVMHEILTGKRKNVLGWIYNDINFGPLDEFFKMIESALGFELFIWQKTFIANGIYRRIGQTTAEGIKELTNYKRGPIDFTRKPRTTREAYERKEIERIKRKLTAAGIETRPIAYTNHDIESAYKLKRTNINDGLRAMFYQIDEMHEYRHPMKPLKGADEENEH